MTRENEVKSTVRDSFLSHCVENRTHLTLFLMNGVKLQGCITEFDGVGVLLERDRKKQFVHYGAISSFFP